MKINDILNESTENQSVQIDEGLVDKAKKLIAAGGLVAASLGANAFTMSDMYHITKSMEKDPQGWANILGPEGAKELNKITKDFRNSIDKSNVNKSQAVQQDRQQSAPQQNLHQEGNRLSAVHFGTISGQGRAQFYSDAGGQNKIAGLFLVPGDKINAYRVSKDGKFLLVQYTRKDGSDVEGWIPADRINVTGKGGL